RAEWIERQSIVAQEVKEQERYANNTFLDGASSNTMDKRIVTCASITDWNTNGRAKGCRHRDTYPYSKRYGCNTWCPYILYEHEANECGEEAARNSADNK